MEVGRVYKVLLPSWVFVTAFNEKDTQENAERYLKESYRDRELIRVEGKFAICKRKY